MPDTLSWVDEERDVSCWLGNAIRTLSAFAQEKLIGLDGRKIKLIQTEELERISQMG